jgi:hypothetical protein
MYAALLPKLALRRAMSTVEIRQFLAHHYRLTPKLLKIQRPSGLGTYRVNYVAWTLAHGVTDSLLDGDKRPSDASVYRLTEFGKAQAAGPL